MAEMIARNPEWLRRARELGRMVNAAAEAGEAQNEVTAEVVRAIDETGIFAMMAPREVGGSEAHPQDLIDVISELSYWDGSAGWYAHAVMTGGSVAGAWMGDRAVDAVFPGGKYQHVAGQAAPGGLATRDGDGFQVVGKFSFASGSPHAQWLVGGFLDREGPQSVMLIGLVPRHTVEFLGNWDVMGLRGTGSVDFAVPNQWVHGDFFHNLNARRKPRGGALYHMGFMALPALSHGAFAIGAARRMLDEWLQFARTKPRADGRPASEMQTFHRDFATLTAELRAAEAWLRMSFGRLYAAAGAAGPSAALGLDGRLSASHAFIVAMRIAQAAFAGSTTYGVRNGNALQRCYRDIVAGNAHFITGEGSLIEAGRVLAGVEGATINW